MNHPIIKLIADDIEGFIKVGAVPADQLYLYKKVSQLCNALLTDDQSEIVEIGGDKATENERESLREISDVISFSKDKCGNVVPVLFGRIIEAELKG